MTALRTATGAQSIRRAPAALQLRGMLAGMLGAVLLGSSAQAAADWHGETIDLMGTQVSVELWHDDAERGQELVDRVLAEYRRIDRLMSTYRDDSEISRINALASEEPVAASAEMLSLVERSLGLSARSNGAFDISYESVGYLYDFRAGRRPGADDISARLDAIDYRSIEIDESAGTIRFAKPGMRINLGGIAKGYAIERAAQILRSEGIENALLNAGGDTRVLGDRRGEPWIVGIRHPRSESQVVTRMPLVDEAISTSGDYERFFEEGGRRYHHIINPATGESTTGMLSVTVIGPDAVMTDGLSTTLFVLEIEAGLQLIETYSGYEAVLVDSSGRLAYSSGLVSPGE